MTDALPAGHVVPAPPDGGAVNAYRVKAPPSDGGRVAAGDVVVAPAHDSSRATGDVAAAAADGGKRAAGGVLVAPGDGASPGPYGSPIAVAGLIGPAAANRAKDVGDAIQGTAVPSPPIGRTIHPGRRPVAAVAADEVGAGGVLLVHRPGRARA